MCSVANESSDSAVGGAGSAASTDGDHGSTDRRVVVSGASGLIGSALVEHLEAADYRVLRLVRHDPRSDREVFWDPLGGRVDAVQFEGCAAVVHLAGESLTEGRWTEARKQRMWDSRVVGTRTLCQALLGMAQPPPVWLSASAIGYYGNCGDKQIVETDPPGEDYLAKLCQAWEAEALPAAAKMRVVRPRFGLVLTERGGALAKMLPFFKLGLGGRVGSGRQYMSWIAAKDVSRALRFCIENSAMSGPVNVVGPAPVDNAEFTRVLGSVLGRPAVLPVPGAALRIGFGELAAEALSSLRVMPQTLTEAGFAFEYPDVRSALLSALGLR